jgi:hypothetical protein
MTDIFMIIQIITGKQPGASREQHDIYPEERKGASAKAEKNMFVLAGRPGNVMSRCAYSRCSHGGRAYNIWLVMTDVRCDVVFETDSTSTLSGRDGQRATNLQKATYDLALLKKLVLYLAPSSCERDSSTRE